MSTAPNPADVLRQADDSFAAAGDVMEALQWVAFAAKFGHPLPPRIGAWLHQGLKQYQCGEAPSLDAALGLNVSGGGNPRAARQKRASMEGALARMAALQVAGATLQEAATLVASLSREVAFSTLVDRFPRSGLGKHVRAARALGRLHLVEVRSMLAEYPDTKVTRPIKSDMQSRSRSTPSTVKARVYDDRRG